MSNVLGTESDLAKICRIAHEKDVPVLADGCQAAVHANVDVQALGVDFYAITGHKLYGPTGIGALYGKRAHLKAMRPWQGGGEMIREVTRDSVSYADPPMRFEAGTPPIIPSCMARRRLLRNPRKNIRLRSNCRRQQPRPPPRRSPSLRLKSTPGKGPIISFEVSGIHPHDLATILDREGVAVRGGHHCAQPLMQRFDVTGTARASFALYNSEGEIDALVDAVTQARRVFGNG